MANENPLLAIYTSGVMSKTNYIPIYIIIILYFLKPINIFLFKFWFFIYKFNYRKKIYNFTKLKFKLKFNLNLIIKYVINKHRKIYFKDVIFISNLIQKLLYSIIILTIFISIFFIPIIQNSNFTYHTNTQKEIINFNPNTFGFIWPIPGYTQISSPFGKRNAPTSGASSFHYGTDIPAPEGTKLIAIHDGEITFRSFLGAGGYTITLSFNNYKISYCHVSPNFIVSVGDIVKQGQVIGYVGPKYVYGVAGNNYTDSFGNPTNGATTGCHLHLRF